MEFAAQEKSAVEMTRRTIPAILRLIPELLRIVSALLLRLRCTIGQILKNVEVLQQFQILDDTEILQEWKTFGDGHFGSGYRGYGFRRPGSPENNDSDQQRKSTRERQCLRGTPYGKPLPPAIRRPCTMRYKTGMKSLIQAGGRLDFVVQSNQGFRTIGQADMSPASRALRQMDSDTPGFRATQCAVEEPFQLLL
jgi:hypothetical protein